MNMQRHITIYVDQGSLHFVDVLDALKQSAEHVVHIAFCNLGPAVKRELGDRCIEHAMDNSLLTPLPGEDRVAAIGRAFQDPWFEALAESEHVIFFGTNFRINQTAQAVRARALATDMACFYVDCAFPQNDPMRGQVVADRDATRQPTLQDKMAAIALRSNREQRRPQ